MAGAAAGPVAGIDAVGGGGGRWPGLTLAAAGPVAGIDAVGGGGRVEGRGAERRGAERRGAGVAQSPALSGPMSGRTRRGTRRSMLVGPPIGPDRTRLVEAGRPAVHSDGARAASVRRGR